MECCNKFTEVEIFFLKQIKYKMIKLINLQRDAYLDNWEGTKKDNINPTHYKGSVQPIDLIDENELNFSRGCIIKYVCRAKKKGTELEDLKKAQYYLNREIQILENKNK